MALYILSVIIPLKISLVSVGDGRLYCAALASFCARSILIRIASILLILGIRHLDAQLTRKSIFVSVAALLSLNKR